MTNIQIESIVCCSVCEKELCPDVPIHCNIPIIKIAPCLKCLQESYNEGYERGCQANSNKETNSGLTPLD